MCLQKTTAFDFIKYIRGRPFDSWGGGAGAMFFGEKKIVQQILENK